MSSGGVMQKIAMCGYYGMCDSQNNVIGHVSKVTKEYYELLKETYDVCLMASPCVFNEVIKETNISGARLGYDIVVDETFTILKRIIDKYKIMKNIWECIHKSNVETLFFYQTDFFFYLYIFLFYKKKSKKIFGLIYHQNFTGGRLEGCLNYIYKKALKKLDGIIYTQKSIEMVHNKKLYMPDYLYDEKYYSKYNKKQKENKVVCMGTMNRYKQLEELVDVFRDIDIPLEIYGRFDDKSRVQELINGKSDNITICDCVLSTEEYYQKLGEAKYSILPYDMQQYIARTSGVLLESIYVGSIPVAPKLLLVQNELPGIGYDSLDELKDICFEKKQNEYVNIEREKVIRNNDKEIVEEILQNFFKS